MNLYTKFASVCFGTALLISSTGCKELPGSPGAQGAAIGGVSGAAAGAVIGGKENRVLGAILGGVLGAGGGYVIGANSDKITGKDKHGAEQAATTAQANPATPEQVRNAATADVNGDGFVTMDEVIAMQKAGLDESEMIRRLRATGQVFELTTEQQDYLRQNGVPAAVVSQMPTLNQDTRNRVTTMGHSSDVLSQPRNP